MSFRFEDITYPVLPLEIATVIVETLAILCLAVVTYFKAKVLIKSTKNVMQRYSFGLALSTLIGQIVILVGSYFWPSQGIWIFQNFIIYFTELVYAIFQFIVYEKVRPGVNARTSILKYFMVIIVILFFGLVTPQFFRYILFDPHDPTDTSFWKKWNSFTLIWPLVGGILDCFLNFYLLRLILGFGAAPRKLMDGEMKLNIGLSILCFFILLMDLTAGLLFILRASNPTGEYEIRVTNAKSVMANAAFGFHMAGGLSYMNLVLQAKTRQKSKRQQADTNKDKKATTDKKATGASKLIADTEAIDSGIITELD